MKRKMELVRNQGGDVDWLGGPEGWVEKAKLLV